MNNCVNTTSGNIINNAVYDDVRQWWSESSPLHLLKTSVNPLRVAYSRKQLELYKVDPRGKKALEVGCGGGILTEEIARMGFDTYGVDPSANAVEMARGHAAKSSLHISYEVGPGESLPYPGDHFDVVFCCDTLEHVANLGKVIAEISRVLKPGGLFIFDTVNRTFLSKLITIKIAQDWPRWAFMPHNLHVWNMFIRPDELKQLLEKNKFSGCQFRGAASNRSPFAVLRFLRQRAKGLISFGDLGKEFRLIESKRLSVFYLGSAIKQ